MNIDELLNQNFITQFNIVDWGYTEEDRPHSYDKYQSWVDNMGHGPLKYLADERMMARESLKNFFPEFESALVFLFSYNGDKKELDDFYRSDESNGLKMGSYALAFGGQDYHFIIKEYLNEIAKKLKEINSDIKAVPSLDIHPVLERDLAWRAGMGWFGKNSMFINKGNGSFNMIGSLLLNKKLRTERLKREPEADHCGQCTACIEACPTDAIDMKTRTINSSDCISTYTIEIFKDEGDPPKEFHLHTSEIFGCDICQDVCPWNKRVFRKNLQTNPSKEVTLKEKISNFFLKRPVELIRQDLETWSNKKFQKEFKGTALQRTGRVGLLKNLKLFK